MSWTPVKSTLEPKTGHSTIHIYINYRPNRKRKGKPSQEVISLHQPNPWCKNQNLERGNLLFIFFRKVLRLISDSFFTKENMVCCQPERRADWPTGSNPNSAVIFDRNLTGRIIHKLALGEDIKENYIKKLKLFINYLEISLIRNCTTFQPKKYSMCILCGVQEVY